MKTALIMAAVAMIACEMPLATGPAGTVVKLQISPKTSTLRTGQMTQFTVIGLTSTGDTATVAVSWSVTGGAMVDTSSSGGKHYGQYKSPTSPGRYKVVAKTTTLTDSAVVDVTPVPVAAVTVSPATANVVAGATVQLTATTLDSVGNVLTGRTVTWAGSNTAVGNVSASGLLTGVTAGTATITATSEGKSGTSTVTVTLAPVASVSVSPASVSVTTGQTAQLTATPRDANGNALGGRVVAWTTSTAGVATVSGSGLVTGVAAGSATITATSEGHSGTAAITVTVTAVPVASVSVSPVSVSLTTGQTVQLTATPKDANGNALAGRVVTWASSNAAVATVNGSGLVTGVATGSATITATSEGQSGTAAVTVTPVPVATVGVSPASANVTVGQTVQLTATPRDASGNALAGRVVTWASSNTAVATVNGSGLVTGVAAGSTTITATSEGKSGTSAVTVTLAPVASVSVSPTSASLTIGQMVQLTATPRDANGNALSGRVVTWVSSNTTVASVTATGLVTGLTAGSVIVTATSEGKNGTAAVAVSTTSTGCVPTGSGVCRYVDGAMGNDANPGTSAQPYRTLAKAAGVVNPGDVVIVRSGVYTGGSGPILAIVRGGTATNLVVFRAEQQWGAVLDGQTNTSSSGVQFDANYARVEGFEIKGTNHYGIDMNVGLTGLEAAKNNIHDVGRMCTDAVVGLAGFAVDNTNIIIEQNLVHDIGRYGPGENGCTPLKPYWQNQDHGIYLSSGTNVTIRSNIFYNMVHGWPIHRFNVSGLPADQVYIVNNTFAFPNPNRDGQIIVSSPLSNSVIANNIFYQPLTAGIWFDAGGPTSNVLVANNITSNGSVSVGTTSGVTFSNNKNNTDPLLVNPTGLDFHLQAGSPAIRAGLSLGYVPTDFDGVSRPQGTALDIGAYQFK